MNAKHTPGPWKWSNGTLVDADGFGIARMVPHSSHGTEAEHDANRQLLAAAPDLLAVVRMVAGNGIPGPMPHFPPANLASAERLAEIVDAARAAIARATGGAK